MVKLKDYLIAMAIVLVLTLLACSQVMAQPIPPAGECYPQGSVDAAKESARHWGSVQGYQRGQTDGHVKASREILDYFKAQCKTEGTVIELSNGVVVKCQ